MNVEELKEKLVELSNAAERNIGRQLARGRSDHDPGFAEGSRASLIVVLNLLDAETTKEAK